MGVGQAHVTFVHLAYWGNSLAAIGVVAVALRCEPATNKGEYVVCVLVLALDLRCTQYLRIVVIRVLVAISAVAVQALCLSSNRDDQAWSHPVV